MLRGIIPFYCSECGKRFMGADIEWNATAISSPLKCPRCGGWHTRPWSPLSSTKAANEKYRHIWEAIDKERNQK